jgi:hypothetical protein
MRKLLCILMMCLFALQLPLYAGLGGDKSLYVGGTAPVAKETEGVLSADDTKVLTFKPDKGDATKNSLSIPYEKVTSLEYGQHAGRRVGATVALGVTTLGIGALPMLFSKKRRHYLTVAYKDEQGAEQAAVFEVGKNQIRTLLKSLEVRSGKKVDYEDEEARKAGNK